MRNTIPTYARSGNWLPPNWLAFVMENAYLSITKDKDADHCSDSETEVQALTNERVQESDQC